MPAGNVIPLRPSDGPVRSGGTRAASRRVPPATHVVLVSLIDSEPPIWRRLELDSTLDLRTVHRILQAGMGWTDSHLHEFSSVRFPDRLLPDSEVDEGEAGTPERDVRLDELLVEAGDELSYLYDLGDAWDHVLRLEEVRAGEPARPAWVLDGARACPLDDAGGIGDWNALVRWLDESDADELEDDQLHHLVERLPIDFDAADFDVATTQGAVSAAALTTALLVERLPPHPAIAALVDALPEEGVRLLASLSAVGPGPDVDRAAALRPLLALLGLVRAGVELTPTGLMKQASVRVLLQGLGWGGDWVYGRSLREDTLPPVRWLRHAAHALHLVRPHNGRLVLTPKGRELDGNAEELWQHLVANLPHGDTAEERMAGALWLLTLRPGRSTYSLYDRHAPVVFEMIAWQAGDPGPTDQQLHQWHLPTLWLLLALQQDHTALGASPEQMAAARDALWGVQPAGS